MAGREHLVSLRKCLVTHQCFDHQFSFRITLHEKEEKDTPFENYLSRYLCFKKEYKLDGS